MNILALDTSTSVCSVAVSTDGNIIAERLLEIDKGHAEKLVPMTSEVMSEAGIEFKALDGFGVTRGPGSFVGVRIGLATARGFALATRKPLVGFSTLRVLAAGASLNVADKRPIVAIVNTRRDQFYIAVYSSSGEELLLPAAYESKSSLKHIKEMIESTGAILVGNGSIKLSKFLLECKGRIDISPFSIKSASLLAQLVFEKVQKTGWPSEPVRPIYLRPAVGSNPNKRI